MKASDHTLSRTTPRDGARSSGVQPEVPTTEAALSRDSTPVFGVQIPVVQPARDAVGSARSGSGSSESESDGVLGHPRQLSFASSGSQIGRSRSPCAAANDTERL